MWAFASLKDLIESSLFFDLCSQFLILHFLTILFQWIGWFRLIGSLRGHTFVFLTSWVLRGEVVSLTRNLEDQASVFTTPWDRVTQLYPRALGPHFGRLLRPVWVTVGLFSFPDHHTGVLTNSPLLIRLAWRPTDIWAWGNHNQHWPFTT
jgi:hypothetical protein